MTRVSVLYDTIRWEEKALLEAGRKMGVDVRMTDCKRMWLDLGGGGGGGGSAVQGDAGREYGVAIQRCVSYYRNLHVTAALEGLGVGVINCLETGILAGNKLFTHMLLRREGVRTPRASVAFSKDAALDMLDEQGYPRVIKPTVGSWGRMISKINGREAAGGILDGRERMYPIYHVHYTEEFVKRPPRDIRAIVIGDRVAAAIYRNSADGEWKTNMALGGKAEPCPVTNEMEDVCMRAKRAVRGQMVGVDLMESDEDGLVVHEVNNTTEYKNTVRVCDVDIASMMIEFAQESAGGGEAAAAADGRGMRMA